MTRKVTRFGLIGSGLAAQTHARELTHVDGAVLRAVFARDLEKAERIRAAHNARTAYSDLDQFLSDPEIDAVIIATPNGLHRDFAIAAAAAGKHVVVEKPLETTTERGRDIIAACRKSQVRLFVIYQMRLSQAALAAKKDIEAGKLGRIILVNVVDYEYRVPDYYACDYWRGTQQFEGGGCLITQTTHLLDLIQHLVGPVASVFAHAATTFYTIETEDVAVATIRFANGALGTVSSSTAAYPAHRHLVTIIGTDGSISFNGEHDQIVFRRSRHDEEVIDVPPGFSFGDAVDPKGFPTMGQRRQLQAIAIAIAAEGCDAEQADDPLQTLRCLDALYRSAKEGPGSVHFRIRVTGNDMVGRSPVRHDARRRRKKWRPEFPFFG
jgi:predicted dehydrogenase